MTNSLIHIRNLVKYYDDGLVKALNGIDLDINQGDFISIIGPSGSGKSTLLHMLGALDKPSSGEIIVDGVNLNTDEDLTDFRFEKIGFVFQLHNLIPNLSVFENIQIPLVCSNQLKKNWNIETNQLNQKNWNIEIMKKNWNI